MPHGHFWLQAPYVATKNDRDIFMFSNQPHTPQGLPIPADPRITYANPSYTKALHETTAAGATA
jgi:hypothetical protein